MTCPACNGKCCRDLAYGCRAAHTGAAPYSHDCQACNDGFVSPIGDRASIVAFLRREYESGPWQGETIFSILADAIEREVDREKA